jgi:hypothetical protein
VELASIGSMLRDSFANDPRLVPEDSSHGAHHEYPNSDVSRATQQSPAGMLVAVIDALQYIVLGVGTL